MSYSAMGYCMENLIRVGAKWQDSRDWLNQQTVSVVKVECRDEASNPDGLDHFSYCHFQRVRIAGL